MVFGLHWTLWSVWKSCTAFGSLVGFRQCRGYFKYYARIVCSSIVAHLHHYLQKTEASTLIVRRKFADQALSRPGYIICRNELFLKPNRDVRRNKRRFSPPHEQCLRHQILPLETCPRPSDASKGGPLMIGTQQLLLC